MTDKKQTTAPSNARSAELEWVDLEDDATDKNDAKKRSSRFPQTQPVVKKAASKKKMETLNPHIILLSLIALIFVVIAVKLLFWDKRERENTERENDTTLSFETEPNDFIVPLESASATGKNEKDTDLRILFLGNGSLADDKTSETNIANIIQKKSNATIYNCAIPGTYMSLKNETYTNSYPYDAFSFYSLCTLFAGGNSESISQAEQDLGSLPEDVKESVDLLQSIDYSELDVLCIYYDGADYLEQRGSAVPEDLLGQTKTTFCGALNSGLALIQEKYPHIRIIVMSPSFVYVPDQNGNYTSSFMTDILPDSISNYVGIAAQICINNNVSFIDNLYGSIYEENADEYLKDNILLNEKGHALLADRFLDALNRFHEYDF